jgi:hypothetical protein
MRLKEFLTDAISHKRTDVEMQTYMKRISQLVKSGATLTSAAEKALDDLKKKKLKV